MQHPRELLYAAVFGAGLALSHATAAQTIELGLPLDCEIGRTCFVQNYLDHDSSPRARDYMCGSLTYNGHNGTDFRVPTLAAQRAGVNVLAAADGQVLRVRDGVADVLQKFSEPAAADERACGNGVVIAHTGGWETQYCHMASGSVLVKPGERVVRAQPIGRVGLSGRTQFPHVHLTVRHQDRVIDPFAYGAREGSCGEGVLLWSAALREGLAYRARLVLNAGFSAAPVTAEQIEAGEAGTPPPAADAAALVAFVRAVGLRAGDVQRLTIAGPDGRILAEHGDKPLEGNKAQYMLFTGRKRPGASWPPGTYQASYTVTNDGKVVLEQRFALTLGSEPAAPPSQGRRP